MNRAEWIDEAAWRVNGNRHIGPRARCFICGRRLTDPVSIKYGVDPDCWGDVVAAIQGLSDGARDG